MRFIRLIERMTIQKFKSIKELSFDTKRINILIGAPNTGKSNILEALGLFSFLPYGDIKEFIRFENIGNLFFNDIIDEKVTVFMDDLHLTLSNDESNFSIVYRMKDEQVAKCDLNYEGRSVGSQKKDDDPLRKFKFYRYSESVIEFNRTEYKFLLPPYGRNLFRVIFNSGELKGLIGEFVKGFGLKLMFKPQEKKIEFLKQEGDIFVAHPYPLISDTIRRLIFYMAAILSNENSVLTLEEPETKAFPFYVKYLAELIANDQNGNQFFITTHNPYFLLSIIEKTKIADLGVFLTYFRRGQTKINVLEKSDLEEIMDEGLALDVFFNEDRFLESDE